MKSIFTFQYWLFTFNCWYFNRDLVLLTFNLLNQLSQELKYIYLNFTNTYELLPLAVCVFLIGLIGFLESQDFLTLLVNTELMMLGINFYLITCSILTGTFIGQMYALCFLAVTAAETAVGLGLLILFYRSKGQISFIELTTLRG